MNRRFPNYRPSTSLRQAIEALREVKERRAASNRPDCEPIEGGESSPASQEAPDAMPLTPGREGVDTGEGLGDKSNTDALASRRIHRKG
ncbi:hypothetical protein [Devosia sp. Naph2]|uniref:hypothetical protein n=1 Tax=Devosia polycyclovorans TaxID=3345148 RepID=UPI0035CEBABB